MEHYNLCLIKENRLKSLRIIKTDSYIELIRNNPGLIHENWGDIYCKIPCEDLIDKITSLRNKIRNEIKDKTSLNLELKIINENLFKPDLIDNNYIYLIKKNDGVSIHIPTTEDNYLIDFIYLFGAISFVEDVKAKKGSLVKDIESGLKELKEMSKNLKQSIKSK